MSIKSKKQQYKKIYKVDKQNKILLNKKLLFDKYYYYKSFKLKNNNKIKKIKTIKN